VTDEPAFLDDFRVWHGFDRVMVLFAAIHEVETDPPYPPLSVRMSPAQARELAADLIAHAEQSETRSRRPR
jgi:hypothetical protein